MGIREILSSSPPNFVSLFAGAGGLDLGFEDAGWSCLYASDIERHAVETLSENQKGKATASRFRDAYIEQADVGVLTGKGILAKASKRRGDVTAIVAGPPCQSWSSAGLQLGMNDPRGRLFSDYVRIATQIDARWLVFENVRGLLTARGPDGVPGSALALIRTALLQAGFQTEVDLLNAADYGVPQRRVRLFMIGYRKGDRPPFPQATHAREPALFEQQIRPWVTLKECLSTIGKPSLDETIHPNETLLAQLKLLTPGSGVRSPGKKETTRPGGHWGYKQGAFLADLGLPARTVTASAQQDWIKDGRHIRRLSPRECAAIQTFPAEWSFAGNRSDQYRLIGNAVPPLLARAVALELKSHIETAPGANKRAAKHVELLPLRPHLASAIRYTMKEEARNGDSRREAPIRRRTKVV